MSASELAAVVSFVLICLYVGASAMFAWKLMPHAIREVEKHYFIFRWHLCVIGGRFQGNLGELHGRSEGHLSQNPGQSFLCLLRFVLSIPNRSGSILVHFLGNLHCTEGNPSTHHVLNVTRFCFVFLLNDVNHCQISGNHVH